MPLDRTPRTVKTRGERRREQLAELENMQSQSESKCEMESEVRRDVKSEILIKPISKDAKMRKAGSIDTVATTSTTARRRQLEFEAAQAEAQIELEVARKKYEAEAKTKAAEAEAAMKTAETKARLQRKLLEKQLAANFAKLEDSRNSEKSYKSKVNEWLEKSKQESKVYNSRVQHSEHGSGRRSQHSCSERDSDVDGHRPGNQPHRRSDIQMLAEALRDAVAYSSPKTKNQELLTRLATSKDLPSFYGDPMEWLQFREAYYESTSMCNYSDTENVWRLRKSLRGEAREAVSSLLIGGVKPEVIIETLELRFGRPENIMYKIMAQLKKLQPLPQAYHNEIVNFSIKIKNFVATVSAIKQNEYLQSPELVVTILSKLPPTLITKWADFSYEHEQGYSSKLELLSKFLYIEANKTAASGVSHIFSQSDKRKPEERKRDAHTILLHTNPAASVNLDLCKFCKRKEKHLLENCSRFKRAMRRDRWRFVRTNNLCYKCFGARHTEPSECPADDCDVDTCGQPHHRLLHYNKPKVSVLHAGANSDGTEADDDAETDDEEEPDKQSATSGDTVVVNSSTTATQCDKVLLKIVPVTLHGPNGKIHTHALLDDGATVTLVAADVADRVGLHGESFKMRARSAWDSGELVCQTEIVNFHIDNSDGKRFDLKARKMTQLNLPLQRTSAIDFSKYDHLISNKNAFCKCDTQPKLLIGQDNYHLIAPIVCISGKSGEPYITKTALGWCVHGTICKVSEPTTAGRFFTHSIPKCNNLISSEVSAVTQTGLAETTSHLFTIECCEPVPHLKDSDNNVSTYSIYRCKCDLELHDIVRRSFAIDSIGVCNKPRQNSDELRAIQILNNTTQLINGEWHVGLPWKYDEFKIPDSYCSAHNRLKSVERKMIANPEYASRYCERVQHLFTNNYAREIDETECSDRIWYLPHFGVDNVNKKKLRLVFDAAAKSNGYSLNDYLLQGPDLLQSLYGIMLRFRENPIGIIGDIKDMFLRIKIREKDQHALRFLWRENGQLKKYAMTSLIFGANCSPFMAQYINQTKNASRFQDTLPEAAEAIQKSQYMDDYIDSLQSEAETAQRVRDVSYIHQQGGFEMRNWTSNVPTVLDSMPKETLSENAVKFNSDNQPERTLGLLWYPSSDMFAFDLSLKRIPKDILHLERKPTKREMLRIVMSIYDVFGFLGPFTIKAKILMRSTWQMKIKWDQEILDDLFISFREWITQLQRINNIRIPRWYFNSKQTSSPLNECDYRTTEGGESSNGPMSVNRTSSLQLHVLCDASPCAYAAVAYWRKESSDGNISVSFIASKSRVASSKPAVTMPRLELQGAVLACRLADTLKKQHRIKPVSTFYWTDSTTVLHWIRNEHRNYKVFIANRLGEIDELSRIDEWNYIPTHMNVADLATKSNDYQLDSDSQWFTGPSFLYSDPPSWPREPENKIKISDDILEKINTLNIETELDLPIPDPRRFSRWLRLLRSTATVLLFIEKCRKRDITEVNHELMEKAEILLLRHSQAQTFKREINLLRKNQQICRDSRLLTLTPVLDENGLLRAAGRIDAARDVDIQIKRPIILDGRDYTARLIVNDYHVRAAHSCNEMVVNELRQKYWLLKLRPTVRTVAAGCLVCRIRKAAPVPQRLGDLPEGRLTHHQRPFTICGVDLFGPIEVTVARQKPKRYGVIFTCLTVRAVHIEIVSTLTADSLIMALRRMAARRGWPRMVYSDNGTNMRGAEKELKISFAELNQQAVVAEAVNKGVEWRFIPPASPNMGGAWERLIRSIKTALKVVLHERAPREEVLSTLFAEIENMINSRPLTHVSVDPRSQEALTPNHFLIGTSSNLPVPGTFDNSDLYLRRQWRIAQQLTNLFWCRWMQEVLPTLIPRKKWTQEGLQLKVGDLVVVVDPSLPRNTWPRGMVQAVHPGRDGRVRIVDVKTKSGVMKRPVTRIALLP